MHMSDALVSPSVAVVTGIVSLGMVALAVRHVHQEQNNTQHTPNPHLIPLMGVSGAFIFAAQMINFSIPGTGSSGHIIGGILLSALLGPWAALITLSSVIIVQCLLFADGGLMALGCNIFNMAVLSCLVAYPLLFRPIVGHKAPSPRRIFAAAMLSSIFGLLLGAFAVTIETEASGITVLNMNRFLLFMLPIHLCIGIGEGLATAAVLCTVHRYKPQMLNEFQRPNHTTRGVLLALAAAALLIGGSFSWIASSSPDGLEWSLEKMNATEQPLTDSAHRQTASLQERTALLPDYNTSMAGIIGSGVIILTAAGLAFVLHPRHRMP